ncbi:unnamed protein product [Clonostachys solani]|uniref:Amidase domain-containing protein n=1 Tax=Clonostachys solani TaxID=160281 RepID=A0A9N9W5B2_9HYPO|nr:unnamed protein product [Clonostachys solani]
MVASPPLPFLTSTQALSLLKEKTITVETYAKRLLERIEERDGIVKAWTYLGELLFLSAATDLDVVQYPVFVLTQARALDKIPEEERGPLHGLAVGVKDVINTKDMPTEYGSPVYKGHRPGSDSSAVAILRAAGALIFGKTTTTEFAVLNSGPNTTNPWDPNRTPGGSSCGSAAAVADFQVPLSLGAQTGGSLIRPAAYTGVFAMKPTHDAISTEGQKVLAPTLDTFGFFARSIEDLRLIANIFGLKDDESPRDMPLKEISVAIMKTPMWSEAGPGTVAAMEKAAAILREGGVEVTEVPFPDEISDADALKDIQKKIIRGEGQAAFLREYRVDKANLSPQVCRLVENHSNYTRKELAEASDTYSQMRRSMNKLAENYSVILTPSAVDEAPLGLDDMGAATFNTLWTGFHMPVINIPAFVGASEMPIGVSLVAPRFRDQHLLQVSKAIGDRLMAEGGCKPRVYSSARVDEGGVISGIMHFGRRVMGWSEIR